MSSAFKNKPGFTIVELLVVIVVIAILAAITIVAYNGVQQRAITTTVRSDLINAKKQLELYKVDNSAYPLSLDCPASSGTSFCVKPSGNTAFNYTPSSSSNPSSYTLLAINGDTKYTATPSSSPSQLSGTPVSVTNLALNGNFSNGFSGWSTNCASPATCVVSAGSARITLDPASPRAMIYQSVTASYNNLDKIYYSARIKRLGGYGFTGQAYRDTGGFNSYAPTDTQFDAQSTGSTVRYSQSRTFQSSQGSYTGFSYGKYASGLDFDVELDDVIVVNLTQDFGAGNEPSASEMDALLVQFAGQWFEGTKTIYR